MNEHVIPFVEAVRGETDEHNQITNGRMDVHCAPRLMLMIMMAALMWPMIKMTAKWSNLHKTCLLFIGQPHTHKKG